MFFSSPMTEVIFDEDSSDGEDQSIELILTIFSRSSKLVATITSLLSPEELTRKLVYLKHIAVNACHYALAQESLSEAKNPCNLYFVDKGDLIKDEYIHPETDKNTDTDTVTVTTYNNDSLKKFLDRFKSIDVLMLVIGNEFNDLSIHENWLNDDENTSIQDLVDTIEKVTYSHSRSISSPKESPGISVPIPHYEHSDDITQLDPLSPSIRRCDRLHLILAQGHDMPAPTIRVTLQQTRTATDMYGKNYTVYTMVVKQGKLEWTVQHRYSGMIHPSAS